MTVVRADKQRIRLILEELVGLIIAAGGFLHKQLILECLQGELVIKLNTRLKKEARVITIPVDCLPALDDFILRFDGRKITCSPRNEIKPGATARQRRVMNLIMELYNETDKINRYSQNSPFVAFAHNRPLLALLNASFTLSNSLFELQGDENELKLQVFLGSRSYEDKSAGVHRMLNFIDFADHHALAGGYKIESMNNKLTHIGLDFTSLPDVGKLVMVCYRQKDRLASFINYGFVDNSVRFVQSVPVDIDLPGGYMLKIGASYLDDNMMEEKKVHKAVKNFQFSKPHFTAYVPNMQGTIDGALEVHYCIIPRGQEIIAFREVIEYQLHFYERRFKLDAGAVYTPSNVWLIEKAILEKNKAYYEELDKAMTGVDAGQPAAKMLKSVISYQRAHIENYVKKVVGTCVSGE